MKTLIDIEKWSRKEHYLFFSQFEEPFFGVTVNIDCTSAYKTAKESGNSFFLYYLFRALKTANEIENFRYRIIDKQVYIFDSINASPTINRPNGTFGFAYLEYSQGESDFYAKAIKEIKRVQQSNDLMPAVSGENVIHFSAIPWIDFTALSHARSFSYPDSSPKISFGKVTEQRGVKTMPVSIHGHHGLIDGYHVGLFVDRFQELMKN
ncbi:chloramphenicol acetyltransferase [Arthrospiribacter ruber]|jgi:chloramphenicol O-acetyltransferase type A|uniref:Chloramphenicol acetyltransferase n=1 Tax=Arthrospiribacter ruber TaxID=2487934 RepID=A0A951M7U3_9BACT|nr:chloramphenicol acetyltransferase [Arthrospiribacter ruber]MBW3466991.1 chloramphenicol acetyltransferase [Arthrospiribacter ruber]